MPEQQSFESIQRESRRHVQMADIQTILEYLLPFLRKLDGRGFVEP